MARIKKTFIFIILFMIVGFLLLSVSHSTLAMPKTYYIAADEYVIHSSYQSADPVNQENKQIQNQFLAHQPATVSNDVIIIPKVIKEPSSTYYFLKLMNPIRSNMIIGLCNKNPNCRYIILLK